MADTDSSTTRSHHKATRTDLGRHWLFGFIMGSADVVPGVSGGTMALVLGIYERFIAAIGDGARMLAQFATLQFDKGRETFRQIEWSLVLPLGLGILTAIAMMAWILSWLLDEYPVYTNAAFFGLVAASITVPWGSIRERIPLHYVLAGAIVIGTFFLVGLSTETEAADPTFLQYLFSGAVASCAMILPGVSGAFILKVLGVYESVLDAVKELDLGVLVALGLGALLGLGTFSQFLRWALRRHHDTTMAMLAGLMLGALRALWPWQTDGNLEAPPDVGEFLGAALCAAIGVAFVLTLLRTARRSEEHAYEV